MMRFVASGKCVANVQNLFFLRFQEQAHQYSLTIVALEDRLLKVNRSKKKSSDDMMFMKQYKGNSFLCNWREETNILTLNSFGF